MTVSKKIRLMPRVLARVLTLDGFEATHAALRRMGVNNEFNYRWESPVQIRTCPT